MTSRSALFRNLTLKLSGAEKCWRYDQFRLMIGEETNEIKENGCKLRVQDTQALKQKRLSADECLRLLEAFWRRRRFILRVISSSSFFLGRQTRSIR